jgi:hypothetical protein
MQLRPEKNEFQVKVNIPLITSGVYRCLLMGSGNPQNVSLVVKE